MAKMKSKKTKVGPRSPVAADVEMGERIRKRRLERKMSQQTLGAILGLSFQQIQKYEKGTNRVNANRLSIIASALEMRPEELYRTDDSTLVASSLIDISSEDTTRMIRAFCRIKDQTTQRQMVLLIESISSAKDERPRERPTPRSRL